MNIRIKAKNSVFVNRRTVSCVGIVFLSILALIVLLSCTAPKTTFAMEEQTTVYENVRVLPGDTLYELARTYGTTTTKLILLNHLTSEKIVAGSYLIVPSTRNYLEVRHS